MGNKLLVSMPWEGMISKMNIRSEKGYTGIDIATSVIVIFIFISIIAMLSYNFNTTSMEIEHRAEALDIAIEQIESMKTKSWQEITTEDTAYRQTQEIKQGYYRTIIVQDYHDIDSSKTAQIIKKVTVRIEYKLRKNMKKIELSTIITRES